MAIARGVIRLSTYAFIIVVIHALRHAYDRERVRATHDLLTGALNRAAFERELETLLDRHDAGDRAIVLAMIDVDDFKRINDTHGHGAGDYVLRALTAAATNALNGRDRLYRVGGDEFAVLMPITSADEGQPAVERFHKNLSAVLGRSLFPTTISMGALVFQPEPSLDRTALMHEADRHMYAGKAGGKGTIRGSMLQPAKVTEPVSPEVWLLPAA